MKFVLAAAPERTPEVKAEAERRPDMVLLMSQKGGGAGDGAGLRGHLGSGEALPERPPPAQ